MKLRKFSVICMSVLLVAAAGCRASGGDSSAANSLSSASQASASAAVSSAQSISSEPAGSKDASESIASKAESQQPQNDGDWVAYSINKDDYKLHISKKDGTGDKVIVNDTVLTPCVAGEWVYYFANLSTIEKVRLDGSQKTKVCDTDAMDALNANAAVTAEYKDGYILYKLVQLREAGGNKPNTVTCYKLDINQSKIIPVQK
ncbi:MAG TPA: DUF5050 domain-containing protein [Caproiciproducens sp.]|nr:DUF5050 domain-containing protein [Caproiciproducens sp.]